MTGASTTGLDNTGIAHVVDVDKLIIQNTYGQNVDARGLYTEFQLTTSIFEPGIRGSVLIYDAHALVTRFPIVGEETIYVSFKTPGNLAKTGEFKVWKVTDEQPDDKGSSSSYRLHFCSPELVDNAQKIVAKSYPATDDAYSIVEDIKKTYIPSKKPIVRGQSKMSDPAKKLVIPMYRPMDAIDMILRRAYSSDKNASDYYLFFERFDSWRLVMFDDLVTNPINARQVQAGVVTQEQLDTSPDASVQKLETWYVYASDKYTGDSVTGKDIRRVISMSIGGRFDTISKIRDGQFESEIVQYSIMDKALTSKNYKSLSDEVRYLGDADQSTENNDRGGRGKERTNTSAFISNHSTVIHGYSGTQASKVFFRLKDPEEKTGVVKKSGGRYQAIRVALSQVQVSITVPGDTMVDVGDIVHLAVPKFESVLDKGENDEFLYGRYIIGAIKDSILTPGKHVMTLDLWKDAYGSHIIDSRLQENGTQ